MLDTVRMRRSVRHYEDRPIDRETIEQLQEAVLRAPSSRNLKPWHFYFVTDTKLLRALSTAKPKWAEFVAHARLAVVVCGDSTASDCWIEDCSIAAAILQLSATELGLGSCWVQLRERAHESGQPAEEYVRGLLGVPEPYRVLCCVAVGHPAQPPQPRDRESLDWEKVEMVGPA